MRLDRRVLLVILPVVALSYLFVAAGLYLVQRESIQITETARLDLHLEQLQSTYDSDLAFARNFLFINGKSDSFAHFVGKTGDFYYEGLLLAELEGNMASLLADRSRRVSFIVFDHALHHLLFFDTSNDPFTSTQPYHLTAVTEHLRAEVAQSTALVQEPGQPTRLFVHQKLNRRTLVEPLPGDRALHLTLQVMVEMDQFDDLYAQLDSRPGVTLALHAAPAAGTVPGAMPVTGGVPEAAAGQRWYLRRIELNPRMSLTVTASGVAGEEGLRQLYFWMLLGLLCITLLTVLPLVWLLRRSITEPIARLDKDLDAVMLGQLQAVPIHSKRDEIGHLSRRIHELHQQWHEALQHTRSLAESDALTGMPNRLAFRKRADEVLARIAASKESAALCYIDLDNFKYVNDKYGHSMGDLLLRQFSSKLKTVCEDFTSYGHIQYARLAGDEFAILAWNCTTETVEEKLIPAILAMFGGGVLEVENHIFPVTVSIGLASYPHDAEQLNALISAADTAMYEAKAQGKNRYERYSDATASRMLREKEVEEALRRIDHDRELALVFMPIMDLRTLQITHLEALLRWQSPALGFVGPNEFFPIAENTGLFRQLDEWVIRQAFQSLHRLQQCFHPDLGLAINLSSAEMENMNLLGFIERQLAETGVQPRHIEFEITETYRLHFQSARHTLLDDIRNAGFKLAIDDFGAGYTSLLQLAHYPVNRLKLDRDFLLKLMGRQEDVIRQVVQMGHSLGLQVTAEGIEDAAMEDMARRMNFDAAQGYGIGKPMRMEELAGWAEARKQAISQARGQNQLPGA